MLPILDGLFEFHGLNPVFWRVHDGFLSNGGTDHLISILCIFGLWFAATHYHLKHYEPLGRGIRRYSLPILLGIVDTWIVVEITNSLVATFVLHKYFLITTTNLGGLEFIMTVVGYIFIPLRAFLVMKDSVREFAEQLKYLGLWILTSLPPVAFWHWGLHDAHTVLGPIIIPQYYFNAGINGWEIAVWPFWCVLYYFIVVKKP